jgi:hypothetical protein
MVQSAIIEQANRSNVTLITTDTWLKKLNDAQPKMNPNLFDRGQAIPSLDGPFCTHLRHAMRRYCVLWLAQWWPFGVLNRLQTQKASTR